MVILQAKSMMYKDDITKKEKVLIRYPSWIGC